MPTVAPGPPTDVKSSMKETSAIITWKKPASVGSGLTGYTITATSSNGGTTRTLSVGATTVQAEITNLTKSKKYTFTVVSLGAANSTPSIQTETKIAAATTTQTAAVATKASGSDTTGHTAALNIIQFQDQRILATNTYTKFKSHAEYLRYLKGKTALGYS
jgi:Fibronectin type III domain